MPKFQQKPKPFATIVALALTGILSLTGCQSETAGAIGSDTPTPVAETHVPLAELTPLEKPKEYQGGTTAVLAGGSGEPIIQNPKVTLPATVTSYERTGERAVVVDDTSRVLALSMNGSLASLVYALGLGDHLVGRDIVTDEPAFADLPVVTKSGHSLDAESVINLAPTLIITDGSIGPLDVVLQLRDAGITLVFVERDSSFSGSYRIAQQVADALGVSAAGTELASVLQDRLESKIAEIAGLAPSSPEDRLRMAFLYVRGTAKIYYLFGAESGADALIDALAGIDIATESNWVGMRPVTDEAIIALNPDLILVMTDGLESVGGIDGLFTVLPALELTNAGQHRRVVDMADSEILGFGPQMDAVLDALARAIYAPEQPSRGTNG